MFATLEVILAQQGGAGGGSDAAGAGVCAGFAICYGIVLILSLLIGIIGIIGAWKVFDKAGEPGVAAIVPIWREVVLAKVSGREPMMGLLLLICGVNVIFMIIFCMDIAKRFGKDPMYGLGLALLPFIFWPMLGFGSAQYIGDRGTRSRSRDRDY